MKLRLKQLMHERQVTQAKLAEDTGIPQSTISRWSGNKVDRVELRLLNTLCEYFGVGLDELIIREENDNA